MASASRIGFALQVVACMLWADADAQTFVPSVNSSRTPLRWMDSNCVFLRTQTTGSDDLTDGSDLAAVRRSAERWVESTETCSYLRFEFLEPSDATTREVNRSGPNESAIVWVERGWPHDPGAAGITTVFFIDNPQNPKDGQIIDADIELNGQLFNFGTDGAAEDTDIENTVVHELGHLMGLDHTCDNGVRDSPRDNTGRPLPPCEPSEALDAATLEATMYNFAPDGEIRKRTPEAGDILGICSTYPLAEDPGVCQAVDLSSGGGCELGASSSEGTLTSDVLLMCFVGIAWLGFIRTFRRGRVSGLGGD